MSDERFKEPPADYWPQKHEAVWDVDGVTCDAEIEVRPASEVERLERELADCRQRWPGDEAIAEVERLREALETIAEAFFVPDEDPVALKMQRCAQGALKG